MLSSWRSQILHLVSKAAPVPGSMYPLHALLLCDLVAPSLSRPLLLQRCILRCFACARAAGTELSYDYKLSSSNEQLRCNCGAASCRGLVNLPSPPQACGTRHGSEGNGGGTMLLPRRELEWLPPGLVQ